MLGQFPWERPQAAQPAEVAHSGIGDLVLVG
jgi:hypothetical protein